MPDNECILRDAPAFSAADFGPLTDIADPWASDVRNHR
jgi:hypothetical protein